MLSLPCRISVASVRFITATHLSPSLVASFRTMATLNTKFKLNTGAFIPAVGFGTWQDADAQESAVAEALKAGYRHIDTARVYGTERACGKAIGKSGIPREEIFVTTKLWNHMHHPDDVATALNDSLKDLDLSYVDLYLMHWPVAFARGEGPFPKDKSDNFKLATDISYIDTYKAMEELVSTGKVKAIGLSNFSKSELEAVLKEASIVPAVHQIELHPWLQQRSFTDYHNTQGIHVTHYSPFGNQNETYGSSFGKLMDDPVLVDIGKKYNKSGSQVALAWAINQGHSVLPKSKTPSRIRQNLEGDFKLTAEELKKISEIDHKRRFNDPSDDWGYRFFSDLDGKT